MRDWLMFMLSASYETPDGRDLFIGGETENGNGKTDILVRYRDRNAFIGECKIWSGESRFVDAIDQLLSYTVWRDTKAALILFITRVDVTAVIEKAAEVLATHPACATAWPLGIQPNAATTTSPRRQTTVADLACPAARGGTSRVAHGPAGGDKGTRRLRGDYLGETDPPLAAKSLALAGRSSALSGTVTLSRCRPLRCGVHGRIADGDRGLERCEGPSASHGRHGRGPQARTSPRLGVRGRTGVRLDVGAELSVHFPASARCPVGFPGWGGRGRAGAVMARVAVRESVTLAGRAERARAARAFVSEVLGSGTRAETWLSCGERDLQ